MKIKRKLKNIGLGMVKNESGQSGPRTQKLAGSKGGINGINWKAKSYFNNFGVVLVKMDVVFLVWGLKNLLYLKNKLMKWADFCMLIQI